MKFNLKLFSNFLELNIQIYYTRNLINLLHRYFNFFIFLNKKNLYLYLKNNYNLIFIINFFYYFYLLSSKLLVDITVIDLISSNKRFKLIYNLLSIKNSFNFFIVSFLGELEQINSISKIFESAYWAERECWDMYGILFLNNKELRRILTDYGFKGFPLRKDFPLTGYLELVFNDSLYNINYRPVQLTQKLRFFNFTCSWENLLY